MDFSLIKPYSCKKAPHKNRSGINHCILLLNRKKTRHRVGTAACLSTILLDLLHVRFEFLGDFFEFRMMQVM
ncbi:hypothetical protein D3C80_2014460 [compost metagenome]